MRRATHITFKYSKMTIAHSIRDKIRKFRKADWATHNKTGRGAIAAVTLRA